LILQGYLDAQRPAAQGERVETEESE